MSSQLLDEHDELLASPSRELTLSTASILGIFFGLALLCALFFGFGYNVGHRSANAAVLSARAEPESASSSTSSSPDTFGSFKPPASTAARTSPATPEPAAATASPTAIASRSTAVPAASPALARTEAPAHPLSLPTPRVLVAPEAAPPASAAGPAAGSFFVQVAAVSHSEDASLLMGALRSRGYVVAQRSEPTDKLIHIQVGPFPAKLAAETMRQRLQADGYNAFIK